MFTGIIESVGTILRLQERGGDMRLHIDAGKMSLQDVALGDSIAVNGVCLTVISMDAGRFAADVSRESLSLTTLGDLRSGSQVNLEKALTLNTRLGGHLVSGHVDGMGTIMERHDDARSVRFQVSAPAELARYIARKGSITVDGVSLTVNAVQGALFALNIVPHTLSETIMAGYRAGQQVNLEVDLLARYLERLLQGEQAADSDGITREQLLRAGF